MNAFILEIPDDWPDEKRMSLYDLISRLSFMLINESRGAHRSKYAFTTTHQYESVEHLRQEFAIPNDVEIIDGSPYDLSKI